MTDPNDQDQEFPVLNLVDHAIVPGSDAEQVGFPGQLGDSARPRIAGQVVNDGRHSLFRVGRKSIEGAAGRWFEGDRVPS